MIKKECSREDSHNNRHEGVVLAFHNTILFKCVRTNKLLENALFGEFRTHQRDIHDRYQS